MEKMQLTIAFNHSDTTFGWKGYKNALTLYYLHPSDNFINEKHAYPAVPGLTPIMNLMNIHTKLLGWPFSDCIKHGGYTPQSCVYKKMLDKIIQVCECYPPYALDGHHLVDGQILKPCDFYTHATCVSLIKVTLYFIIRYRTVI